MRKLWGLLPAFAIAACFLLQTGWTLGWAIVATVFAVVFGVDHMLHLHKSHGHDATQAAMDVLFPQ